VTDLRAERKGESRLTAIASKNSYSFSGEPYETCNIGAGAIGGLVGTVLASIGEDVVVIVRAEKLAAYRATCRWSVPLASKQ